MNSQLYSTEPLKRCRQASLLYCMTKESTKCDLVLLFPYPQMEWCGKKKAFPFPFSLTEAEWRPSRILPSQPRSCSLLVSSGPEGRGKGQKRDSRCCFAFLSMYEKNMPCILKVVEWYTRYSLIRSPRSCCFTQLPSHRTLGHPFPAKGFI